VKTECSASRAVVYEVETTLTNCWWRYKSGVTFFEGYLEISLKVKNISL
jgi:hypothetical protein